MIFCICNLIKFDNIYSTNFYIFIIYMYICANLFIKLYINRDFSNHLIN